jgi:hypothetical protein
MYYLSTPGYPIPYVYLPILDVPAGRQIPVVRRVPIQVYEVIGIVPDSPQICL